MVQNKKEPEQESDFRKYLDERFKSLHFRLDTIEENQEKNEVSTKELFHIVDTMRILDANKCVQCTNTKEIAIIKTDLGEVLFIKKYWKPLLIASLFSAAVIVYGGVKGYEEVKEMIQTESVKEKAANKKIMEKVDVNTKVINNNAEVQKQEIKKQEEATK